MKHSYMVKYLKVSNIVFKLAEKVISGKANAFEYRAWIRGQAFQGYLLAKANGNNIAHLALLERVYNDTISLWFCPNCWRLIEWPGKHHFATDMFGVRHYPEPPVHCEACWQSSPVLTPSHVQRGRDDSYRLEAEDNQPARQPPSLQ